MPWCLWVQNVAISSVLVLAILMSHLLVRSLSLVDTENSGLVRVRLIDNIR